MAIEPMGTIMSMQTQTAVRTDSNAQSSTNASTDALAKTEEVAPDAVTLIIDETSNKEDSNAQEQTLNQAQNVEKVKRAVEQLNKSMPNSEAVFGIHEATQRVTIKIIDKSTKKIIKELPAEETLDMIAKVWEMAGILVDEKR